MTKKGQRWQPYSPISDFAAVVNQVRASALAAVLHQAQPGKPFAPIAHPDTRATLAKFRRVLEEDAGVSITGSQLGGGWSYQPPDEQQLCGMDLSSCPTHSLPPCARWLRHSVLIRSFRRAVRSHLTFDGP